MLERWSHAVMLLWGWRRLLSVALAGSLGGLAQAPFHAFPVLWIAFPVLVWALDGAVDLTGRRGLARFWPAFRVGWAFGFGWFLAGLWWIGSAFLVDVGQFGWMLPIAIASLSIGLGLFHGLATLFARLLWSEGPSRIVALAIGFFLADWLRGHVLTGFPWGSIGQGFAANGPMMQIAAVLGGYGVTLLAVVVFAAPAVLARALPADRRFAAGIAVVFVGVVGWGGYRLVANPTTFEPGYRFRVVQPAIDQWTNWSPTFKHETVARFVELSSGPARDAAGAPLAADLRPSLAGARPSRLPGITHLVWPESAFPFLLANEPWALATLAELLGDGTTLFTGATRAEAPAAGETRPRFYNSILALGPGAEILAAYDKVHLVPFGEYLPFQDFAESLGLLQLTKLRGGYTPGPGRRTLSVADTPPFAPLVCYEAVFPGEVVAPGERPRWMLNVTNDAWFGMTPGPWQHLHQVRLRAVEEGLPVVRAANDGVSAAIDPLGRVVGSLTLGASGAFDFDLPRPLPATIAARHGDLLAWLLALLAFSTMSFRRIKNEA
ncbi:apolipoprotein N-acyltransferase [Siculibacillus lacustris]|uniref:Apolipoprotein N-acyltransferase n=1 Tax=Siculibacillus lacustris TaxID=1549641 RepID=A0A4Q9VLP5_9HYPH|nr:apolipoprotein N-acyltransferase [Siculibacillus lacustris]TBW36417.1 apolipoprotein N-acyltransferase [Siculibacillus lacustris]